VYGRRTAQSQPRSRELACKALTVPNSIPLRADEVLE
jgi:hypothetical protein